jgi:hypothetical protein
MLHGFACAWNCLHEAHLMLMQKNLPSEQPSQEIADVRFLGTNH